MHMSGMHPLDPEHPPLLAANATGDDINSKQLRDDLMTMLIAGHETTAAVLTWTFFLLSQHPEDAKRVQEEVSPFAPTALFPVAHCITTSRGL